MSQRIAVPPGSKISHDSQATYMFNHDDAPKAEVSAEELAMWITMIKDARNAPGGRPAAANPRTMQRQPKAEGINKKVK